MTPSFYCIRFVFFLLNSRLGIARQWSRGKFEILTVKPQSHVRIFSIERGLTTATHPQELYANFEFPQFILGSEAVRNKTKEMDYLSP